MDQDARTCLGCGCSRAEPFLDLGKLPLANAFVRPDHFHLPDPTFPLAVAFCRVCYLVQITDLVPPEQLFTEYLYFSSYSESFLAHARLMTESLIRQFKLGVDSRVLEVGSNDGYLLQNFRQRGIPVLGIEPAKNIAKEAERRGIPTQNSFFGTSLVENILARFGQVDIIIGNNVLAHVPTINDFLRAVKACLKPGGVAVFEFPHVKELIEKTEFDTIYHEHVFYYSFSAIKTLAERAELEVFDVSRQSIHGGSLRIFIQARGARLVTEAVGAILSQEKEAGLTRFEHFATFGRDVAALKQKLCSMLRGLKAGGKRLAAYGAPAKGNTLLNFCGLGADILEFTVDRSPHKQGLFLPGSRLPIRRPVDLLTELPDYTLILPWNLAPEIIAQQEGYLNRGGKFITPIPNPRILSTIQ